MATPKKYRWWYEAIIDWMLTNPDKTLQECAKEFGVTPTWLSIVTGSDMFQQRFAERRAHLSAIIGQDIVEKASRVAALGLDRLVDELQKEDNRPKVEFVAEVTDKMMARLGYGVKGGTTVNVNQNTTTIHTGASREAIENARQQIRKDQFDRARQVSTLIEEAAPPEVEPDFEEIEDFFLAHEAQ